MTNADKFLKDEKYIFDIAKGIAEAICYDDMEHLKKITEKEIKDWFTSNTKPTLTEDERVILRNIPTKYWQKIRRDNYGVLEINGEDEELDLHTDNVSDFDEYNHLFQFIKERRRIRDRRIVRRAKMTKKRKDEIAKKIKQLEKELSGMPTGFYTGVNGKAIRI